MTGDRSRLWNFVKKFIGTVRFRNDHFGAIMGYGDYVIGESVISRVYYVEGLGHNLFSVGQFCDSDLEVAFRKHSCYVQDTDGVELIKGSRGSNLYTISVEDMMKSSPICLLSKASKNKSWLWHRRLNHLNFDKMADENVPALTRSDDQILPFAAWVLIGKSNFFWNTLAYEAKNRAYSFQVDETQFVLDVNLMREDLEITPIDQAHQCVSPPLGDAIMDFVNELGYIEARPLEFIQAIHTFLTDKANLGSPTKNGRKDKPHVIPYCRFMKLIICHLGRTHNIHQRSASSFHLAEEDLRLETLLTTMRTWKWLQSMIRKLQPKREERRKLQLPNNSSRSLLKRSRAPSTAKPPKPKPVKEKSTKPTPLQKAVNGKVTKLRNVKSSFQLVDEPDEEPAQPEPKPEPEPETEYLDGGEATRPLPIVEGKGKAIATDKQAALSLLALHTPKRRSADTDRINNGGNTEILQIGDEQGNDVTEVVNLEEKTAEIDEGRAE
ncbi:retrovirus-related pol polyprotein from transposon TNT 1-94 [Tanacetum coccineum]|uniref:Retrovirus-related pol polyprotein from transposon TNT 1-94 n=1 Tax=Tanacetum coccineum TaxID=301880 RepID=A0ABQ5BFT3_9ASTR